MTEDNEPQIVDRVMYNIWFYRSCVAIVTVGLLYGFFIEEQSLFYRIISAGVWALIGVLGICFVLIPACLFLVLAVDIVSKEPNFKGVVKAILSVIALAAIFDLGLLGGVYIYKPILSILFTGSLDGTFYSCADYVIMDEGNYCADGRR